jgi:histidinol dehydrogenase
LVTGPGNIYVAAAKRALRGVIGIDSEAGPTEIAILADESARAGDVAADLISQAEHDVIAAAVLVTTSEKLAGDVVKELEVNPNFPEQHIITKESWDNAEKIVHEGFIYVKYTDLMFYK